MKSTQKYTMYNIVFIKLYKQTVILPHSLVLYLLGCPLAPESYQNIYNVPCTKEKIKYLSL